MKLSFDKSATRKLELWATHNGIDIDDLEGISELVVDFVEKTLVMLKPTPTQPEKGAVGA